jgi:hypothetical protein
MKTNKHNSTTLGKNSADGMSQPANTPTKHTTTPDPKSLAEVTNKTQATKSYSNTTTFCI